MTMLEALEQQHPTPSCRTTCSEAAIEFYESGR
jgi:hypothetical protein